jgi:hypothetical protein
MADSLPVGRPPLFSSKADLGYRLIGKDEILGRLTSIIISNLSKRTNRRPKSAKWY